MVISNAPPKTDPRPLDQTRMGIITIQDKIIQDVQKTALYLLLTVTFLLVKILIRRLQLKPIAAENINKKQQTTSLGLASALLPAGLTFSGKE